MGFERSLLDTAGPETRRDARQNSKQGEYAGWDDEPLGNRHYGDGGDLHGGAGHVHCERGATAYCGKPVGGTRRIDLGTDVLPGFERDRAATVGMVLRADRTEEVLHDVRGHFYREFVFVRLGAEPGRAGDFPDFAGCGRRRIAAKRASDY